MIKRDLYYERIPTKSLREDVRLLGTFLGKVIRDQEGKEIFELIEKTRLLSKINSKNLNKHNPYKVLSDKIKKLSSEKIYRSSFLKPEAPLAKTWHQQNSPETS